ncbi:MAG: DUF5615 family PIN-like protein [Gammaproteobacteria bacterium]|nr:DUF5615 family PIN-like protein [Gammaproteobacteria bacterium]
MVSVLADENISAEAISSLRAFGFDVSSGAEEQPGAPDTEVFARAVAESRVLITFDRDYGELIFGAGHAAPPGIVYLRHLMHLITEKHGCLFTSRRQHVVSLTLKYFAGLEWHLQKLKCRERCAILALRHAGECRNPVKQ